MPDRHIRTDDERIAFAGDVKHAAILNIRSRADADIMHVAANDRSEPCARVFFERHIADDRNIVREKN